MTPVPARLATVLVCSTLIACGDRDVAPLATPAPLDVVAPRSAPAPTPPPWWTGTLAAAVPHEHGVAIALVPVQDQASPRMHPEVFDHIEHLAWHPDGDALLVSGRRSGDRVGGRQDLWLVPLASGPPRRVTDDLAWDGRATFTPDGRGIVYERYDAEGWSVFRLALDGPTSSSAAPAGPATRLTPPGLTAMEPALSPDGVSLVFSSWHDGRTVLMAMPADGAQAPRQVAAADVEVDLRAPAYAPGDLELALLGRRFGASQVRHATWRQQGPEPLRVAGTVAPRTTAFAWAPTGGAIAVLAPQRRSTAIEVRSVEAYDRRHVATLPAGARAIAWRAAALPDGLPAWPSEPPRAGRAHGLSRPEAIDEAEPTGLVRLPIDVPGPRIHSALADDFAAMRSEVQAATGRDFLGRLSDMWRPLDFDSQGSAFFSWHKTGRAFDTRMESYGPGGRRDMLLLRDEGTGRTYWRMMLRAGAQDGSVGQPLREAAWRFAIASDSEAVRREGGERGRDLYAGYWVDFTALAARYGWHRIPSIRRTGFDWREDWAAIEFWHYERRDGLRWSEAVLEVYDDAQLQQALDLERLRERGISTWRLGALGLPDWAR